MIIILLAVITFFGVKFAPKNDFFDNSFSVDQTRALKGLFAIVVMFHHLYGYLVPTFLSIKFFQDVGHLMVGGFFLISGYGLMYGVKNKAGYLKGFFRKRILAIIIPYYVIDIFYIAMRYARSTDMAAFKTFVIESLFGMQLWFVPVMVLLYLLFRLFFIGHEKRNCKLISPIILTSVTLIFVIGFTHTQHMGFNVLYGSNWNDTVLCFVVGMWYCILKDKITAFLKKYYYVITAIALVAFAVTFIGVCRIPEGYEWPTKISTLSLKAFSAIFFSVVVLLLSMKVHLGNGLLNLCGDLSFELYLSHAIFIDLLRWGPITMFSRNFEIFVQDNDLYFTGILVCSLVFSFVVHKLCGLVLKPLRRSTVKKA